MDYSGLSIDYKDTVTVSLDNDRNSNSFEMNKLDFTAFIDSSLLYPTYKSIKENDLKHVDAKHTFYYKCNASSCEFPMNELKQSIALKALGIKDSTFLLVDTIRENPELFTAGQCGGYIIKANGQSNVLIKNESIAEPQDDSRFAFIDLTETKRRLLQKHENDLLRKRQADMAQLQLAELKRSNTELIGGGAAIGGLAGGAVVFGILKVLKKIH